MVKELRRGVPEPDSTGEELALDVRLVARLAQRGPALGTERAAAAGGNEGEDHMIAGPHLRHVGSYLDDDAAPLVPEDHGRRPRAGAVDDREVRMTDARRCHFDEHLSGPGRVDLDLLHPQRPGSRVRARQIHFIKDGCFAFHADYLLEGARGKGSSPARRPLFERRKKRHGRAKLQGIQGIVICFANYLFIPVIDGMF